MGIDEEIIMKYLLLEQFEKVMWEGMKIPKEIKML